MEAPEFYQHQTAEFPNEKQHSFEPKPSGGGDHFIVEDLLDFSNEDAVVTEASGGGGCAAFESTATDSSTVTVVDSCNSSTFSGCEPSFNCDIGSRNFTDPHFCGDLSVPYEDLAELEWLSNFVEESFSSEDLQKLQLLSGMKARGAGDSSETPSFQPDCINSKNIVGNASATAGNNSPIFHADMSVPAKARSKRSRAAPCNWASRLLLLSPATSASSEQDNGVVVGPPPHQQPKTLKTGAPKKRSGGEGGVEGRKCLHCATDKTPQWRTGPMGPKTLCNACGVRYKSGRLVPEYRPAASPTFVLTKHSNSHRKVLELRRQKETMRAQQQQFLETTMMFDVSNADDYLIHQHVGPDFRQLI
ncbi:hypothetical protein K2173_016440 [Erythroxylum novogranatense]|uniref:GATA transcription factor n=1 Tax=Erythroxylum novogranatense TaxID=1862640 RepID=A0AAV8SGW8_9ROSI|nr:hypothetical protein K2173_016440 [Erythroxylum novogranatense]